MICLLVTGYPLGDGTPYACVMSLSRSSPPCVTAQPPSSAPRVFVMLQPG